MRPDHTALRSLVLAVAPAERRLSDDRGSICLAEFAAGSSIAGGAEALRGCCVLLVSETQMPAVLAAIELDGVAGRILLCPPDLAPAHVRAIINDAAVDAIVTDGSLPELSPPLVPVIAAGRALSPAAAVRPDRITEWVLFTSGTTGRPKMVVHTLSSLIGPLDDGARTPDGAVWSTFYDVRRYGGLQILLRGLLGGGSMVLSSAQESIGDFLGRAAAAGVTHISGTPSHWRRALMSQSMAGFAPTYVRLSGEAADQAILDHLQHAFPAASLAHAFASTEAGVGFEVRDRQAGFPVSFIEPGGAPAELRVSDGVLCIRSGRTAARYLGAAAKPLRDADGFVVSGDMLERSGDRYVFVGRREGVINVGGQKVYPEEVEAVINQHAQVRMSRVHARTSPVTGAIVAAEIVLKDGDPLAFAPIRDEIIASCRASLSPHKVPVTVKLVASLKLSAAGKLVRHHA